MKEHKVFKTLLPDLSDEEYAELEKQCVADKRIHVAPVTWKDWLVDGYHRAKIAKKHGLDMPGPRCLDPTWTEDQVIEWIYRNQVGRRNLSTQDLSHFRACLYESKKAKKPEKSPKGKFCTTGGDAAKKVAEETGVSPRTVKADAKKKAILDSMPPAIRDRVRTGKEVLTEAQLAQLDNCEDIAAVGRAVRVGQAVDIKSAYQQTTGKKLSGTKAKPAPAADNGQPGPLTTADVKRQIDGVCKSIVKHRTAMAEWLSVVNVKQCEKIRAASAALDKQVYIPLAAIVKGLK